MLPTGYDIYTPNRVWVLHNYKDSQSDLTHNSWGQRQLDSAKQIEKQQLHKYDPVPALLVSDQKGSWSTERIKRLLEMSDRANKDPTASLVLQLNKYGLGDRRTLDEAIAFSGVNLKERRITANRCASIDFVPYTPHPLGPAYIPKYDAETGVFVDVRDEGSIYYPGRMGTERLPEKLTANTDAGARNAASKVAAAPLGVGAGDSGAQRGEGVISLEATLPPLHSTGNSSGRRRRHRLSLHGLEPFLSLVAGQVRVYVCMCCVHPLLSSCSVSQLITVISHHLPSSPIISHHLLSSPIIFPGSNNRHGQHRRRLRLGRKWQARQSDRSARD